VTTIDKPHVVARAKTSDGRVVELWSNGPLTSVMGLALPGVPIVRPRSAEALTVALAAGRRVVDAAPSIPLAEVPARYATARREAARPVAEIVTAPPAVADVTALAASLGARRKALAFAAQRIGWEIVDVEIDLGAQTARVWARRRSRAVMLDVRQGRATIERWECGETTEPVGRRGDRFNARTLTRDFLGRSKHNDPRDGLRDFADYLIENGNGETLALDLGALLSGELDGMEKVLTQEMKS